MFTNEPVYQLGEQAPLVVPDELLTAGATIADIIERSGIPETTARKYIKQGYVPKGKPDREKSLRDAIDELCEEYGIARNSYGDARITTQMLLVQELATESIERIIALLDIDDLERLEGIAWALYKKEYPNGVKFYESHAPSPVTTADVTEQAEWDNMPEDEQAAVTAAWQRAIDDARDLVDRHREAEAYHNAVEAAANDAPPDAAAALEMLRTHPAGTTWRAWLKANDDNRKEHFGLWLEQFIRTWLARWPVNQCDTYEYNQLRYDLLTEMQAEAYGWETHLEAEQLEEAGYPLRHLIDES